MAQLPTDRTTANTPAEHVADHNTLHATHNVLDDVGSNGDVLTVVAGTPAWAAQSATGVWTQAIDETGASLANWTAAGGTWASDGTVINQTDTAATHRYLGYTTDGPLTLTAVELELRIRSGTGGTQRAGFVFGSMNSGPYVYVATGAGTSYTINGEALTVTAILAKSIPGSAYDTWFTIRALATPAAMSIWVDGVFKGTFRASSGNIDTTKFNLTTYASSSSFRNVKLWRPALPWE